MATANSPALPPRRDWMDLTIRLATSWAGLFTAYVVALILALTKFKELRASLHDVGVPPSLAVALITAFPLLALVFSTIPAFIEQRRIKRYSEITGAIQTAYFTLRPRENEEEFERADNAHQEVLRWMENTREPVLYLTGSSGTGKSSLLSAWVIPKLRREKHVVIQIRGYEDLLARIKEELMEPGAVWDKAPGRTGDLRTLLSRAAQRLGERRLFIVVDQFEEFLILKDEEGQNPFRQFLSESPIGGLTFVLVYRPEYEGLIQDQVWPKQRLDTNRKMISAFTENAAQEFMRKSGLTVNPGLLRAVLREAADIEQTVGLIRPVTINMCGLVLGRFSSGLPGRFRGGLIRGFVRECLSLPEVRDAASKLIPQLISGNVTKRPRTIAELAQATLVTPSAARACLRRLGESDRAIVRPLDQQQETWEISHDFLVPLLDSIVARRTVSLWRSFRPWLPWSAAAIMGIAAVSISLVTSQDPRAALTKQGWTVAEHNGDLMLARGTNIPPESISILRRLHAPVWLVLSGPEVTDVSAARTLKNLTRLSLSGTDATDMSGLRELKNLTGLELSGTNAASVAVLRELTNLTELSLNITDLTDISALNDLKNLTVLNLAKTGVKDVSALGKLTNLTYLSLARTNFTDVPALRELKNLTGLNLSGTSVADISALRELTSLTQLFLATTGVADISALKDLKKLTLLDLEKTNVTDVSALRELRNLYKLNLSFTNVTDVSALEKLTNLTSLNLAHTNVADVSALQGLKNLFDLDIRDTKVTDVSALRDIEDLEIFQGKLK